MTAEAPDPRWALDAAIVARAEANRALAYAAEARRNAEVREAEARAAAEKANAAAAHAADVMMDFEVVRLGGWPVPEWRPLLVAPPENTARDVA